MTAPSALLTDDNVAILRRIGEGGNPAIHPAMRRKLRRLGMIVAIEPPRAARLTPGRQRAPEPRRHVLTPVGIRALADQTDRDDSQRREIVAASVARHASIDELIGRSSVGVGLKNIRENGIDAELARLETEMHRRKR